jgi:hypothetical protein
VLQVASERSVGTVAGREEMEFVRGPQNTPKPFALVRVCCVFIRIINSSGFRRRAPDNNSSDKDTPGLK